MLKTVYFMNQKKRVLAVITLMFVCVSGAFSQENKQTLNLHDCIEYGLANNPTSTIFKNEVELAKYTNWSAIGNYLPSINGNYSHDFNAKLQTSIVPAGIFGPDEIRMQIGQKHINSALIQVEQKIYDQTALIGFKAMRFNDSLARLKLLKNNEDLIYNTANAYYNVLIIVEQEKLLNENEKQYADLLEIMKLQYDKGTIRKMDYDRTRVAYNNIKSQLNVLKANKEMAVNRLKTAIGMPIEQEIKLNEELPLDNSVVTPVESRFDVTERLDYKIQEQNIILTEIQTKIARYSGLPTLSAYARYGANAYGTEFGPSFKNWFDYSAVGFKVNVPIFNGLKVHTSYKTNQVQLMNLKESARLNIENYKLESQNASTQLYSSYNNLTSNKENMVLAKDVYDASNVSYKAGQSSLTDLLNSDYSYKEAQSNYIYSLLNYITSRLTLEKSKGTLTNYISTLK